MKKGAIQWLRQFVATGFGAAVVIALSMLIGARAEINSRLIAIEVLVLVPASICFWMRHESYSGWEWLGQASISAALALFFVWLDCQAGSLLKVTSVACSSKEQGFSLVLTVAAIGYAIACFGGAVRVAILALWRRLRRA